MAEKPRVLMNEAAYDPLALNPEVRQGAATVRFTGATGLVGTAFGIPGITATRMATGHYRVQLPRAPNLSMKVFAQPVVPTGFQAPTGVGFRVTVGHKSPASGTIDLFTTRGHPSGIAENLTGGVPMNPTHLSEVDLFVWTTPITRY